MSSSNQSAVQAPSKSLRQLGWQRLKRDKIGWISLWIVGIYITVALLGWVGVIGGNWQDEVAKTYAPPTYFTNFGPGHVELTAEDIANANAIDASQADASAGEITGLSAEDDPLAAAMAEVNQNASQYEVAAPTQKADTLLFGADGRGRDVLQKVIEGTSTSLLVGLTGSLLAILIGTTLGAMAGYLGGKLDDLLMWFYSVFTSIPDMLLLLAFAAVTGRGISTVIMVMALTSWTGTFRLMRAEFMKNKNREYVKAADAIGASHIDRMFKHILPNVSHLLLVQFSILTVGLIKYEAILSFLGFGVGVSQTSWGSMLAEAPSELLQGYWWQMLTVTLCMSILVTAFSMLTDSLRDALDPKVK